MRSSQLMSGSRMRVDQRIMQKRDTSRRVMA